MEPSTLYKATVFPTSPPLNSTFYPLKIGYQEKLIRSSVIGLFVIRKNQFGYRLLVIGYQEKINSVIGYSLSVIRKKPKKPDRLKAELRAWFLLFVR